MDGEHSHDDLENEIRDLWGRMDDAERSSARVDSLETLVDGLRLRFEKLAERIEVLEQRLDTAVQQQSCPHDYHEHPDAEPPFDVCIRCGHVKM